ncbi:FMN-linked oxidoreductase [Cylindrobasidium torrendii FP15055 ss-10]|uniref:Dihydroorotate oxidase n=1 Tax=Cylindrobasidium torrendii FP15055 ss-10 TaxID=1314674 RepID=A0A0D7B9C0_9AGAR|nr:FMN-linked oxidoreductase [Cylindrobasidium torrendii FP15055 ss-10]
MVRINSIEVSPPLINTSCAWASELSQLEELYHSPHTGAVTTRTSTLQGYNETEAHTVVFSKSSLSSLNSYGYSPHPNAYYLDSVKTILSEVPRPTKPFIISLAASTKTEIQALVGAIQDLRADLHDRDPSSSSRIAIEFNTSCPNISNDSPPTGYVFEELRDILGALAEAYKKDETLTIGLKMPPYVYRQQFIAALDVLESFTVETEGKRKSPWAFLTATNTLGNSLMFSEDVTRLDGTTREEQFGVPTATGGLAGEAIHALSLGNVHTYTKLLRSGEYEGMRETVIIGVGGVTSYAAATRMRKAGADVVGCATLLGREGVQAFKILSTQP